MPKFRSKFKRPPEDPALEAEARRLANERAIEEFGPEGFCFQISRIGDGRSFAAFITHQPGKPGDMPGKTITVTVE
jgi:hypothetical protein